MKLNKDLNKVCGLLLAKSIKDLHEDAILADILVGDALANEMGFSYSFNCLERISTLALNKIVKQMKKNIDRNYEIKYVTVSKPEALEIFKTNKFKTELINDSSASQVNLVYFGSDYVDICEQLSIAKLSAIKSFELLTVGGVY
jgi:threonyl-tRNA synthetase